jgi:hypothetical protein
MAETWKCDTCGRHFTSTKNRIELVRKIRRGPNSSNYMAYQDICTDFESYDKKMAEKRRRNHVKSLEGDEV